MKQVDGTECLSVGDTRPPSQVSQTVPAAIGRTLPPGSVHLGISKEIAPTLRALGVDPDPVIREAGLDPRLFDDAMSVIPFAALGRLYTLCVARTGCAAFRTAGRPADEHPVVRPGRAPDAALAHCRRGRARARVEPEHAGPGGGPCADEPRRHGPAHVCDLPGEEPERAANPRRSPGRDSQHPADVVRLWLETGGGSVAPGRPSRSGAVSAPFPSPGAVQPGERHHRLSGPRFGSADRRGRSSAAGHAGGADPATEGRAGLRILGRHSAAAAHAADEQSLLGRRHRPFADDAPAHPEPSPKGSGMGYRAITNEIRFEIARQLLQDTQVPLAQISAALGYSEASAFTRAFRRWSGQTPTTWRTEGHQE